MASNMPPAPVRNLNSKAACPRLAVYTKAPSAGPEGFMSVFEVSNSWEVYSHLLQLTKGDFDTSEQQEGGDFIADAVADQVPAQGATAGQLLYARDMAVEEIEVDDDPNAQQHAPRELSVAALVIPDHAELWFYTNRDFEPVFADLAMNDHISRRVDHIRSADPLQFTLLWQPMTSRFDLAMKYPDSNEWLAAQKLEHIDSSIPEASQDALAILSRPRTFLVKQPVKQSEQQLSDDRYIDHLADWEVFILARTNFNAAQYLLAKRMAFEKLIARIAERREKRGADVGAGWEDYKGYADMLTSLHAPEWSWTLRRILAASWYDVGLFADEHF